MATLIELFKTGYDIGESMPREARARQNARAEFGDAADDPQLFANLQQMRQREQAFEQNTQMGMRQENRLDRTENRQQAQFDRQGQAQDFEMQGARQDRSQQATLNLVNGLRSARDRGEDMGTAFDRTVEALSELGVSPDDIPGMRQALVDNPAVLDDYYASLTGQTQNDRVAQASPAATDKTAELAAKAAKADASTMKSVKTVLDRVAKVRKQIEEGRVPVTGFMGGAVATNIPMTPMLDTAADLDTIRANLGFDKLQEMRDASPTGGALGQVSDFENRLLQASVANLDQRQSSEKLLENLALIEGIYTDIGAAIGAPPAEWTPAQKWRFNGGDPSDSSNYTLVE